MGFSRVFSSLAIAAVVCLASIPSTVLAQNKPLPWDGRGQDLTVATLESKYMLHIFKQRQSGSGDPADYVTIAPKGRASYNGDTGVINVAVDAKAIFGGQTNFRRSELVQNIAGETGGTTFFRASVKADSAIKNKHKWQVIFPESHQWEVFVDASVSPVKIQFLTESRVQWEADLELKTWYNFGIAVASSGITLYTSTGDAALKQTFADKKAITPTGSWEFHYGLLTLSQNGGAVAMVDGQDILSFNGVSVENKVSTTGGSGGDATAPEASPEPAPAPAPAPAATPAPAPAPAVTTKTPATRAPVTDAPAPEETPAAPSPTVKPTPAETPKPASTKTPSPSSKCKVKRRRN